MTEPRQPLAVQDEVPAIGSGVARRTDGAEPDPRPSLGLVLWRCFLMLLVFVGLGPLIGGLLFVFVGTPIFHFIATNHGSVADQGLHPLLFVADAIFGALSSIALVLLSFLHPMVAAFFLASIFALGVIPAVSTGLILIIRTLLSGRPGWLFAAVTGAGTSYATMLIGFGGPMDFNSGKDSGPNPIWIFFVLAGALSALACWHMTRGMVGRWRTPS